MGPALDVAVVEDAGEFAALEEEWEDLHRSCPRATPFQSWAWLYSWWEHYGEGAYELRLVTLRDGEGLLVGLIPLMLERRRWGFGRLLFVGTGPTDYNDLLVRGSWEEGVFAVAGDALARLGGWQVADLQQLRPGALAWDLFERWKGPKAHVWQEGCPVVDVQPWDKLVASLSKNHRSTVRRAVRRAEADGVRRKTVKPEDAQRAARRWVDLHREAWQGREILPEHLTPRWAAYAESLALRMMPRGLGQISEFWRNGEVLVSTFWLFGADFVGYYHVGASREALQRYQVSSLLIWDGINIAGDRHSAYLDTLRGEEPYKLRWASRVIPNYRIVLGRNPVTWAPYAAYVVLRFTTKRYVKAESTPQWIKNAAYRLRKITGL